MSDCQSKACCAKPATITPAAASPGIGTSALELNIAQMDCPTEEGLLRQALGRVAGVGQLDFNLVQRKLRVSHSLSDPASIISAIRAVGMEPVVEGGIDVGTNAAHTVFSIENMCCPTEEALIRSKLDGVSQVEKLEFNLMQRRLAVWHSGPVSQIEQALKSIGMDATAVANAPGQRAVPAASPTRKKQFVSLLLGLAAAVGAEIVAWSTGVENSAPVILLAVAAIAASGLGVYKKG